MKAWVLIVLLSLAVLTLSACLFGGTVMSSSYEDAAAYSVGEFDYAISDVDEVRVNWQSGSVTLQQTAGEQLRVSESGTELPDEKALHWLLKDGVLYVEFCASGYSGTFSSFDKKLTVEVPENIRITVNTTSAGIAAEIGAQREVRFQTTSGTIEAGKVVADGEIRLGTTSGGIRADSLTGKWVSATTTSGSIKIDEISAADEAYLRSTSGSVRAESLSVIDGHAEAGSNSGSVRIATLRAGTFSASTTSGDVTVGAYECKQIDIGTTSGSVRLELGQSFGATVTVRTTSGAFNGRGYRSEDGRYVWGDGTCEVAIQTTSGSVTIQ